MEYKAERASVPTREVLERLRYSGIELQLAESNIDKVIELADDKTKAELIIVGALISNAIKNISEILTCDGRIYDEFSEFLRKEKADDKGRILTNAIR